MTALMKWALIGGVLVSIAFVAMELDRGRYVVCTQCGGPGILDTRTGTFYENTGYGYFEPPVKVGAPSMYWNRVALTARLEKTECAEDWFEKSRIPGIDFQPTATGPTAGNRPGSPHIVSEGPARCYLGIRFVVKNNTPDDVEIEHGTVIWPWAADSGVFDRSETHDARVNQDVSVPAGLSAAVQILAVDRCEAHASNWGACLKQDFGKAGSLVVFVKGTRYEIELPLR